MRIQSITMNCMEMSSHVKKKSWIAKQMTLIMVRELCQSYQWASGPF